VAILRSVCRRIARAENADLSILPEAFLNDDEWQAGGIWRKVNPFRIEAIDGNVPRSNGEPVRRSTGNGEKRE